MFFIRVDSNQTISGGHIMRCLAIAKALIINGKDVTFLIADDNPVEVLKQNRVSYVILNSDWQDLMSDLEQTIKVLSQENDPYLLIDTYCITKEYVEGLKAYAKVGYLGSKSEYLGNLDFLINYSSYIDYNYYKNNYFNGTKLLLGISYAPLRDEFQNQEPHYREPVRNILITTGNTDNDGMVGLLLDRLRYLLKEKNIIANVIIGRMFNNKELLHVKYDDNSNVKLYENVSSMSTIMRNCDLAISANGTTIYELSAMAIPTISFAMVEEQVKSAEGLDALRVIDYCGTSYTDVNKCVKAIIDKALYYIENYDNRIRLAQNAHNLIDGNGCQKIIDELF